MLKRLAAVVAVIASPASDAAAQDAPVAATVPTAVFDWTGHLDPAWVGPAFWANRLQDWRVIDDRLVLARSRATPLRTVHVLTHRVESSDAAWSAAVHAGFLDLPAALDDAETVPAIGLLVGVGHDAMDPRGAAIVHGVRGVGTGFLCGVSASGELFIEDTETGERTAKSALTHTQVRDALAVRVDVIPRDDDALLVCTAGPMHAPEAHRVERIVAGLRVTGNIALAAEPGKPAGRAWFDDLELRGPGIVHDGDAALGPILSAQHTLSRGVLKMTVQLMPVAPASLDDVELLVADGAGWRSAARAPVVRPGYTAHFRIADWDSSRDIAYRIVARRRDGTQRYDGLIRHDPIERDELVLGALSCNHNNSHNLFGGWGAGGSDGRGDWPTLLWFPHQDLVDRVRAHAPDLLFFAGDQLYEGASPSPADRAHLEEDYLYKWYLWCWAYRELTRDLPAIVIPDDHDVYQGNLWGAGGRKAPGRDNTGGYVHPADFVKLVERTQTSHLPDPPDPAPVEQGIGVYFTDLVYGRVSFAILEDRKFKSGCADPAMPPTNTGRPDHFNDPAFDTRSLDLPKFTLLGERQLAFLDAWALDWHGCDLKAALSQTPFANLATHHGRNLEHLIADLDSNGWPQSGRRRALERLRRAGAVHICGDQHLATLAQHGIDVHRDGPWSFCMPAAANFYPRQWSPPRPGANRAEGAPGWSGDHVDGFGNLVTVHAVTNPRHTGREPADLHDGMAGYGIVRFDRARRTVTFECWPRYADPLDDTQQYPGWPRTVSVPRAPEAP